MISFPRPLGEVFNLFVLDANLLAQKRVLAFETVNVACREVSRRGQPLPQQRTSRTGVGVMRWATFCRLIALTSIPSSSFSSASINSCGKPSVHSPSDSVRAMPNLKWCLSEFTNKGSAHAIAGAEAHFPCYHVN